MLGFFKNSFRNTIRVFNGLNPDQDQHSDLDPISLQRLLADDKVARSKERVKFRVCAKLINEQLN